MQFANARRRYDDAEHRPSTRRETVKIFALLYTVRVRILTFLSHTLHFWMCKPTRRIHGPLYRGRERGHPERVETMGVSSFGGAGETNREKFEERVKERGFWCWLVGPN